MINLDTDTILREALWMVPVLVALVVGLVVVIVGFGTWMVKHAIYLGTQFRIDVLARLTIQDNEQVKQREILSAIKELLQTEVHKLRSVLWRHDARLSRLEEHNGLSPLNRNDSD